MEHNSETKVTRQGQPVAPITIPRTLCVLACVLMVGGCAAGWNHTSDVSLQRTFDLHESEFQTLLTEVQADSQLTTLQRRTLIYSGRTVIVGNNGEPGRYRLLADQLFDQVVGGLTA